MQIKGLLTICDRCCAEQFSKYLESEVTDGGFGTRLDKFEKLPEGWDYILGLGSLCPDCAETLKNDIVAFFAEHNAEKHIAPSWQPKWMKEKVEKNDHT